MKVKRDFSIKSKPDMLPLIDVVFLLLVFFIYAMLSMSYHNGIALELPSSSEAEHLSEHVELVISVDENGQPYLAKEAVVLSELGSRVKAYFEAREKKALAQGKKVEREVILSGHKALAYQGLFKVMDTLKKAGIQEISLQAERVNR
ncbi:MAG: biopolymer transporter ExbD [Desulfobacterales bacterium]|nr:biopolymer transporter ExbD [Desulfobacterales bacterium]